MESMPITLKQAQMSYKDSNGVYHGINTIAENETATQIALIQAAGAATRESIPQKYTELADSVDDLKSAINDHSDITSANLMGIDVQQNLYSGSADWSGEWLNSDTINMGVSDVKFEGYSTVYSSQSWRRYCKNIPVEAGKTYTFETWIKPDVTASVFIYLQSDSLTTNPATVSPASRNWNNTPADTWKKLSLTFTCTASGNVSPFAHTNTGGFYIAKYNLVEGDSVFSLSNALSEKATTQEVSAVGDYKKYEFSNESAGQYWNLTVSKAVAQGTKLKFVFDSYTGTDLSWLRLDGQKRDGTYDQDLVTFMPPIVKGAEGTCIASNDYVSLRIQFARSASGTSSATGTVYIATSEKLGITNDLLNINGRRVFHIAKDGTGDFTSFVEGINTACSYMDSIVYVGAGTYNLLDELGADYIASAGAQKMGVVLKNRVHVICSSQTVLEMDNDSTLYDTEAQYLAAKEYLSVINTGVNGCTLENAVIIDNNVRYSIHDDLGWSGPTPYTNRFINCTLIHKNGKYGDCIGGGLGENGQIEIRGCYLEGDANINRLAYYHGCNNYNITNAKGHIVVADNYFANIGAFWVHKYGVSTEMSTALVANNSFGSAPQVTTGTDAQDNMRIVAWNNEIRT